MPADIVAPSTCPDCGGSVVPTQKFGRTRRAPGGREMLVPYDIAIPTCDSCGAEWMDHDTAVTLSALDR